MSGGELSAVVGELQRIPGMVEQVRSGVMALRSLANVPAATTSTGHPVMSAAIVGLGAEMIVFTMMCGKALLDDIEALTSNRQRIEANEAELASDSRSGIDAVCQQLLPGDNRLGGSEHADWSRAVLKPLSVTDDHAAALAGRYRDGSDAVQAQLLRSGRGAQAVANGAAADLDARSAALRGAARQIDGDSWVAGARRTAYGTAADAARSTSTLLRNGGATAHEMTRSVAGGLERGEALVDRAAYGAGELGRRADRLLSVDNAAHRSPTVTEAQR